MSEIDRSMTTARELAACDCCSALRRPDRVARAARAGLADAADHADRAVRARRRHRRQRALAGAGDGRNPRPDHRGRERRRRGRHHRQRPRRQGRARRLHLPDRQQRHPRLQPVALQEEAVRLGCRLRADRDGDGIAAAPGRAQGPAGEQPAGADRLYEGEPGQDAVFVRRRRLRHAPALRAAQLHARRQHHHGALSRRRPGAAGRDRRPHRLHVHHDPERRGAGQAGHGEGHRRDGAAARRDHPRHRHHRRAGPAGRRGDGVERLLLPQGHAASRSSTRCTRRSRR